MPRKLSRRLSEPALYSLLRIAKKPVGARFCYLQPTPIFTTVAEYLLDAGGV